MKIILASQSPRRQELLQRITKKFDIVPAVIDETVGVNQLPKEYVLAMAVKKATVISEKYPNDVIIGCDTIVSINKTILGKPHSKEEAFRMLKELSGKTHDVYTSLVVIKNGQQISKIIHSLVEFYPLEDKEIERYLQTNEYEDKAGAYGIQGAGALFIKQIKGDYYSIMGLPIASLQRMLRTIGID